MALRILLFVFGVTWGIQFIVFRARWTTWASEHPGPLESVLRHDWFRRNMWLLAAIASFGWALVTLAGGF